MEKLFLSSLVLSLISDDNEFDDERIEQAEDFSQNCVIDSELTPLP